jgi:hypothetical protein
MFLFGGMQMNPGYDKVCDGVVHDICKAKRAI